jgi:predicted Zn-dependent protease
VTVSCVPPAASAGTVPNVASRVQQAIDLWNQKVGSEVRLQLVSENATADIAIRWATFTDLPSNTVGLTEVTYRADDNTLETAKVRIEASLPEDFQVQVIAHELGHALGIDGHSPNPTDLMFASAHLPAAVTTRDQNTILASYQDGRAVSGRTPSPQTGAKIGVRYVCGSEPPGSE